MPKALYYALPAPVAQWIEQVTSNDKVVGSNPIGGAIKAQVRGLELDNLSRSSLAIQEDDSFAVELRGGLLMIIWSGCDSEGGRIVDADSVA